MGTTNYPRLSQNQAEACINMGWLSQKQAASPSSDSEPRLGGIVFLGETLTLLQLAGGAIIVIGVVLVTRRS